MEKSRFMSQDEWNAAKAASISNDPIMHVFNIAQLGITPESINSGIILLDGKPMPVTDNFWTTLAKVLGINKAMLTKVNGVDNTKVIAASLMDGLKRILAHYKDKSTVTLQLDKNIKAITGVNVGGIRRLTNTELFSQAEKLLNEYSNLAPKAILGSTNPQIELLASNDLGFEKVGADEVFNFGFSLGNVGANTQLGNFIYRLVCSNGMMGLKTAWDYTMGATTPEEIMAMQAYIAAQARNMFVPEAFGTNLALASDTPASFKEAEKAYRFLVDRIDGSQDENLKDHAKFVLGDKHIFGYNHTMAKIKSKGLDVDQLSDKIKENIQTDMTVWDLVNALTYVGSHDTGIAMVSPERAMREGGKLFYSDYDLAYRNFIL